MTHVIIHFGFVVLGPALQRRTGRQDGISRVTELRINRGQGSSSTFCLCSTDSGCRLLLCLRFTCRAKDAVDCFQTLCFAGPTSEVVGRPTIQEGKIRNEERVLDIGEGGEGSNLGI
jgi:hypothetical protein